ncbi:MULTISPECIES: TraX family protein [unclassified Trichocoleus]|uniref:TraX family protein n=1 Tax=unclassified Trichocoleus TaxID=2628910 RepID=UPI0018EF6973|nr:MULTISPECIES: TraX family protein [unclassified Trichocoleus]
MQLQLNNFHIKLLAAIFMVIDHVGVVFFPNVLAFRVVGRLSFPLFAWLLTQGEQHTRNIERYLIRLLLLGIVSQPLYVVALQGEFLNILFTLMLGVAMLRLGRRYPEQRYWIWAASMVAAELLKFEYGAYGLAIIGLLSQFRSSYYWWGIWLGLHLFLAIASSNFGLFQLPAVVTPLLLLVTNQQKGPTVRWFYTFYPAHLLLIWAIARSQ